ncbi:unnamed protein product [Mytilus coruscus]|uniref:Ig-like domain-containing protein n=1 Tax=Mytilus coruscus TaxID=42192 RepID=A0A6J8D5X6_MYTCO|nr:unnamed protein product [Mytilus coruscus]
MYNYYTQHNLKIRNTKTSDSGEYCFKVGHISRKLQLKIKGFFLEDPCNVECIEGEDAILTCKVRPGSPPVKWLKGDIEILHNEYNKMYNGYTQHNLKIRNTKTSDSGEYCVQVGRFFRKLHLRITGIPGEITEDERNTYMKAIQSGTEVRKYVRIQVIGKDRVGKTSLVHRLLGYKTHDGKSTDGIAINRKCQIRTSDGGGEWIVGEGE